MGRVNNGRRLAILKKNSKLFSENSFLKKPVRNALKILNLIFS
jgi:hypothetical protein